MGFEYSDLLKGVQLERGPVCRSKRKKERKEKTKKEKAKFIIKQLLSIEG